MKTTESLNETESERVGFTEVEVLNESVEARLGGFDWGVVLVSLQRKG